MYVYDIMTGECRKPTFEIVHVFLLKQQAHMKIFLDVIDKNLLLFLSSPSMVFLWDSNIFIVNKKKQIRTVTPLKPENHQNKFYVL